jgi:hypothetical protein
VATRIQVREQTAEVRTARRGQGILREVLIVGLGYLIYSQVRGLAGDRVLDAFSNGYRIVTLEQEIGIFWELALQAYILPHDALVHFFNLIYFYGLFPLLLPTAIWLYVKRPHVYILARNAFLISGAIAVCFYLLLPTAPPRLLSLGFIDTLSQSFAPSYNSIPGVNHFAALPSMHVGWNFLTALAIFLALGAGVRGRSLVLLLPVMMFTSTVVTGNHYFLDGALGVLVASTGFVIALKVQQVSQRRAAARALQAPAPSSS